MILTLKEVTTRREMKAFIQFSFTLYKDDPHWIPPLIRDELATFDKEKNPAFATAEARLFLAYRQGRPVGRIAAIINWQEVKAQGRSKIRFGWFDVVDDVEVTRALLDKVAEIGRENKLEHMEGPMGFNNLDRAGLLTMGYDQTGTAVSGYNPPYYVEHLVQLGFAREKGYTESHYLSESMNNPALFRGSELVQKRYKVRPLNPKTTQDVLSYVDEMFDVFNQAYARLPSFVAVTERQKEYFKSKYVGMINPELVKFVLDEQGRMIAFGIGMPDFAPALKKANGRLFPLGWYHLLKARRKMESVVLYLIGVLPQYQNKGIPAVILGEGSKVLQKLDVTYCIRAPELDENNAVRNLFRSFNPVIHKRRCTYRKDL